LTFSALLQHPAVAQTAADIRSAQRQAEIIQRQEQDRIQRDQEDARRQGDSVNGMDTRSLLPKTLSGLGQRPLSVQW